MVPFFLGLFALFQPCVAARYYFPRLARPPVSLSPTYYVLRTNVVTTYALAPSQATSPFCFILSSQQPHFIFSSIIVSEYHRLPSSYYTRCSPSLLTRQSQLLFFDRISLLAQPPRIRFHDTPTSNAQFSLQFSTLYSTISTLASSSAYLFIDSGFIFSSWLAARDLF